MRKFLLITIALIFTACSNPESTITGEVFVTSNSGQSVKLGAVTVGVMTKAKASGYDKQLADFYESADYKTVTDADGKFTIKVPPGQYHVLVKSTAEVKDLRWDVPVDATKDASVSLNSKNLAPY